MNDKLLYYIYSNTEVGKELFPPENVETWTPIVCYSILCHLFILCDSIVKKERENV